MINEEIVDKLASKLGYYPNQYGMYEGEYDFAEFAELIIKDCISMIEKESQSSYGALGDGLQEAIEIIRMRYGVE